MKKKDNSIVILKATSLFTKKKFSSVIRLLEPEIFNYRENFNFYNMLGISYLYTNDMESAESYLKRANHINDENSLVLEGLAYIKMKQGKFNDALKIYLNIIDLNPKNKIARLGLNSIRKNIERVNNINLNKLLPNIKTKIPAGVIIISFLMLISILTVIIIISNLPHKLSRPEIDKYQITNNNLSLLDYEKTYLFMLSDSEIINSFNKVKKYFNSYRDNLANVEINRLLNSNASEKVKATVLMLKNYIQKPDFSNIKDSFSFSIIKNNPELYNGCNVVWKGKIGNLHINETAILFDLWIGDKHQFEGVISVALNFAAILANGEEIEVLGKFDYTDKNLILQGSALHKIILEQ